MEGRSDSWPIVVGVDGSEQSHHALAWAREEARLRGTGVRAAHVWAPPVPVSEFAAMAAPIDIEVYEKLAHGVVDDAVADIGGTAGGEVPVAPRVVRGYPSTALCEQAEGADLLVVGSRGHGGFAGLLLGSVSHQCVHHATSPVAVVPLSAPMPDSSDVVVGVDGSDSSQIALRWAAREAVLRAARLSVVHAWSTPYAVAPGGFGIGTLPVPEVLDESRAMLHALVDRTLTEVGDRPKDIELLAVDDRPARALLERSAEAGLLVVGSRGHGGFAELMLGSVSHQCLHHARCAVVVVPHAR
ncbi:MAG: universal stress protein [Actinomycetota bacterium]